MWEYTLVIEPVHVYGNGQHCLVTIPMTLLVQQER